MSSIIKAIKRVMAGEYSRELSAKTYKGQRRIAQRGFRVCGRAGVGLRRLLVDESGNAKAVLAAGERKAIHGERIVLVPGPEEEIAAIRQIFDLYANGRKSVRKIVSILNDPTSPTSAICLWNASQIFEIIMNEKYIGHNVYGKRSGKLKTPKIRLPASEWVVAYDAFQPIIDPALFEKTQIIRTRRTPTRELLVAHLHDVWSEHGRITSKLCKSHGIGYGACLYKAEFGLLVIAYEHIGYHRAKPAAAKDGPLARATTHKLAVTKTLKVELPRVRVRGSYSTFQLPSGRHLVVRFSAPRLWQKRQVWRLSSCWRDEKADAIILMRGNPSRDGLQDFVLVKRSIFGEETLAFSDTSPNKIDGFVYADLETLLRDGLGLPKPAPAPSTTPQDLSAGANRSRSLSNGA
jgi:hypothetical protein